MKKLLHVSIGAILAVAFLTMAVTSFAVTKEQLYEWNDARLAGQQLTDEQLHLLSNAGLIIDPPEPGDELDDFDGPDDFGYYFIDSDEEGGPAYDWQDISQTGTQITGLNDDDSDGPFDIGFDFNHYGENKDVFYVGSNGSIGFSANNLNSLSHYDIPSVNQPNDVIQFWQRDMHPGYGPTAIYYENMTIGDRDALVIEYNDLVQYGAGNDTNYAISCEIILFEDGDIILQYNNIGASVSTGLMSIGIENSDGSTGLEYAYNNALDAPENETTILFYVPSGDLEITVLDDITEDAVEGARVDVILLEEELNEVVFSGDTDIDGITHFVSIPTGEYEVYVSHDDYFDGYLDTTLVEEDAVTYETIDVTYRYSTLSGNVTDAQGTAIEGATVTIEEQELNETVDTDVLGYYEFMDVPADTHSVTVFATGYIPETAEVIIPGGHSEETQNFGLDELGLGTLVVTFEDQNGDPIPNGHVHLSVTEYEGYDQDGMTDVNGEVTFEDVPETGDNDWELEGAAYYFVNAWTDGVWITADVENTETLTVTVPERPADLTASDNAEDITLTWSAVHQELNETLLGYEVYMLDETPFPSGDPLAYTTDTEAVLEDLPLYQELQFTVAAVYEDDETLEQYLGGGSDTATGVAIQFPGYSWAETEYDWIELSNNPDAEFLDPQQWNGDYPLNLQEMGFEFPFYGELVDLLYLNPNGYMYLEGYPWWDNFPINLWEPPGIFGIIAPFSNPMEYERNNSGIYYMITEDDILVIEWWLPYVENDGEDHAISVQAQLYPDGTIQFHYQDLEVGEGNMGELAIGIADFESEDVYQIFPEEINWMPSDESAVELIGEDAVFASLDLTVSDDTPDQNPVTDFDVYLSTGQMGTTDGSGIAHFSYIPIQRDNNVGVTHRHPYYSTLDESVTLNEGDNTATVSVSPNSQPPQNVNYDGFSENTINLWWDAPEPGYNVNEPDIWAFHNGNAYTNYWQYTDDIGEGVQYSDIELSGPFDINAVEFNLYQYYAGQPEARLDIWDISDWNNPEAIFTHSWFPNLGQYTTGWEYIEVGLTNLDHTNIAITVTTSGEGNNGGYRYMLRYDGDWENDYYMDIYMLGVGSGDEYLMNYGYEGNLLVNTYVTRHGDYISYPTGGGGGGNLEPGPNGFNPNNGGMTLDQMIESELAVQDDYGRWGPKHEKRYAAGMTAPGPTVDRICHPTPRMPERQGELDDFQDEILYYNVYHDDELVYSTTDAYEMMYTDDGAEEGTEYIYTITAVYDIDGNGAEGEGPPSDPVAAMAVMPPSSPEFIDYTHDDQNLTATLDWDIPLTNENGSDLDDLDGFNLYCNNELIQVLGSTDDTYTHNLTNPGWYWYVITAFDDVGNESESTDLGWEIIGSPDIASDFETNGDPLSGINFEWGEPASGPEEGFNGSTYLWATELSGQYEDATLYTLTMPSLFVENENAMATFEAWWDFENEFDGWIMLGSLDEGESWFRVDWWPEIGMTNYNTDFWGAEYDNPLVDYGLEWGDHFISGQSMGGEGMSWSYMGIRLADYVGQNIILMIAAGTDEANHLFDGLYIDDVELWNVSETVYGDIDGTVSASETGAAIEGANVTVQGIGVSTVTDQNGDYLFEDLPVQDWTVTVNVFGYNDEEAVVTLVGDAAVTQDFALLKPEIEVPELVSLDLPSGYEGEYNLPVNNPGDGLLTVGSLVIDGIEEGMLRIPGNNDGLGSSVQHGKATIVESISLKNPNIPKQKGPVAGNSNGSELDETIEEWMFSIYYEGVGMAWDDGSLLISSPDNGYIYEYDPYTGDNIDSYPVGYWGMPFDMQLVDDELWVLHLDMEGEMTRENGFIADDLMEDGVREVYVVNWYDYRNSYYSDVLYGSDFNWDNYTTLLWGFALQPDLSTMYLGSYPVSSMEEPVPDYIHPTGPISGMDFDPDIIDSWELDNVTSMTWYNDRLWAATVNTDNVEELDEPGQLYEIDSEGNILAVYDFPSSPMGAAGLTFDDEGALWYCDFSLTNIYRLELDLEPAYLYSITEYLEVEGNNNDVMTFGIDIPDWAAEGETFEATIQLATNTEDEVIEIPVYLNILGDVIERNLELDAGWNLVGLDILLDEDDVSLDSIFADEIDAGNLVLVKNGSGEFFDPELGINNIGDWATPEGYKVNVAEATTVSVWGAEISDQSAIDVGTGWNMVAYYPNTDIPADFALESIADDLVIAKAGDGTFYLPEYNYNGIGDMMPRAGYQLKMDADATLMYPDVGDWGELNAAPGQNAFTPASVDPEHFEIQTFGTITNMSILLDGSEIDEESLKEGDEIAFYDPRGNRVGVAVWNENDLVGVALWGDDPLTEVVEGFVEGENLFARLWLSEEDLEIPVEFISPSGDLKFSPDGLLIASVGGTRESVIPSEFFLAQNYPNPFNPTTTIKYGLRDAVNVQLDIYNILGQRVHTLVDGPQKAGYYTIVWNGKDLNSKLVSSGTYFYQVHAGEFVKVRKMVIIK